MLPRRVSIVEVVVGGGKRREQTQRPPDSKEGSSVAAYAADKGGEQQQLEQIYSTVRALAAPTAGVAISSLRKSLFQGTQKRQSHCQISGENSHSHYSPLGLREEEGPQLRFQIRTTVIYQSLIWTNIQETTSHFSGLQESRDYS